MNWTGGSKRRLIRSTEPCYGEPRRLQDTLASFRRKELVGGRLCFPRDRELYTEHTFRHRASSGTLKYKNNGLVTENQNKKELREKNVSPKHVTSLPDGRLELNDVRKENIGKRIELSSESQIIKLRSDLPKRSQKEHNRDDLVKLSVENLQEREKFGQHARYLAGARQARRQQENIEDTNNNDLKRKEAEDRKIQPSTTQVHLERNYNDRFRKEKEVERASDGVGDSRAGGRRRTPSGERGRLLDVTRCEPGNQPVLARESGNTTCLPPSSQRGIRIDASHSNDGVRLQQGCGRSSSIGGKEQNRPETVPHNGELRHRKTNENTSRRAKEKAIYETKSLRFRERENELSRNSSSDNHHRSEKCLNSSEGTPHSGHHNPPEHIHNSWRDNTQTRNTRDQTALFSDQNANRREGKSREFGLVRPQVVRRVAPVARRPRAAGGQDGLPPTLQFGAQHAPFSKLLVQMELQGSKRSQVYGRRHT